MNKNLNKYLISLRALSFLANSTRSLTTSSLPTSTAGALHPWFITGFTDAEGCFHVSIVDRPELKSGKVSG